MQKRPLTERLAKQTQDVVSTLGTRPLSGTLYGASLLSRSRYLNWHAEKILQELAKYMKPPVSGQYSYSSGVFYANHLIKNGYENDGYNMMYHLIVEPFYRMEQS